MISVVLLALALAHPAGDDPSEEAVQDLVILGETRPIILRMRVMVGDKPFRSAWMDSVRTLYGQLDRNGDGKVTVEEAEAGALAPIQAPTPGTAARPAGAFGAKPKKDAITVDELAEALRAAAGPFRIAAGGLDGRRTDALFDQFDRDKDGQLTKAELASIAGSLRRLDRDDNELIGADEVAPLVATASAMGRPARDTGVPPVVELTAGESPLRLVRFLFRKYDTGSSRGPGKPDSKLSNEEFAIPAAVFAAADANGDGTLNTEEVRRYLEKAPRDAILDVTLGAAASGHATARVRPGEGGASGDFKVRQLAEDVVEVEFGQIRLDIHIDDGAGSAEALKRVLRAQFEAADDNQDGYVEEGDLIQDNGTATPLAGIFLALDRDRNGKVYLPELDAYADSQATSARARLTLTASNEGRALFGMLDLNRDRQLGAREVMNTFARVSACDRDGDGRISPEEIPHHIQLTLSRGDLAAPVAPNPANQAVVVVPATLVRRPTAGPDWFRKMDRNRDGDVSRREFFGNMQQFERLDRDHDGLISPDEATAADTARAVKGPGD
jgi:Ca2+-binding EF-hand superfamily protein